MKHQISIILHVDEITTTFVNGWALDLDHPMRPVTLRAYLNNKFYRFVPCNKPRSDVREAGYAAEDVGFRLLLPEMNATEKPIKIEFHNEADVPIAGEYRGVSKTSFDVDQCAVEVETQPFLSLFAPVAPASPIRSVVVQSQPPLIMLDEVVSSAITGWVINTDDPSAPLQLDILIDHSFECQVLANLPREDVKNAGYGAVNVGFKFRLSARFFDGTDRLLEFRGPDGRMLAIQHGPENYQDGFFFQDVWRPNVITRVDGFSQGFIKGWALAEDRDSQRMFGQQDVLVTLNGEPVAQIKANHHRPDVGRLFDADPNCGFEFNPPAHYRRSFPQPFRFFLLPDLIELNNSPYETSFITDQNESRILALCEEIDLVYSMVTRMRRQAQNLLPQPSYTLDAYDPWARVYQDELRKHILDRRSRELVEPQVLVSVICPTYKPDLKHFVQAIESVLEQSYKHLELIIVDDGSRLPELTAQIKAFQARDPRVHSILKKKNQGISAATNLGIEAATGDWIAFFDHDDLLVPVAIEVMLMEAQRTGAHLLYSDEDKIDDFGRFSDPAFKTSWNYRMMLSVNYICHFVMAKKELVRFVGPFNSEMDGAQDHDYLLRVSEHVSPEQIVHVPHIIYHWRKTATSTSTGAGAKHYAVAAGVNAVSRHLQRLGRGAEVRDLADTTFYKIDWLINDEPKVRIVVPFKEQIPMTRLCIELILERTEYQNYEIVLVDNWSTSADAATFCREVELKDSRVSVLRVEEEFNYSRLNNLALVKSDATFFVLLNNDLLPDNKNWLKILVNEALSDERVGIVGGKFYYPDGTLQHGGVALGCGGVAIHIHTGIGLNDPGYGGRAQIAQELSAVTAACLLVRADVYRQVNGLDERELRVAFNDIDLCLKVRAAGYKIIWTPEFTAEHRESVSRGSDDLVAAKERRFFHEIGVMMERWGDLLKHDPFYSPHFSLDGRPFFDLIDPKKRFQKDNFQIKDA
jgi:GT2 family glycosyltransferase